MIKKTLFSEFAEIFPNKFINVTNGVTTRRWILCSNPLLSQLYTEYLKTDEWTLDMSLLKEIEQYSEDEQFQAKWEAIKMSNKKKLVAWIEQKTGIEIDPNSMFDVQIKRIHEYKRQFMNILYAIHRYLAIKDM